MTNQDLEKYHKIFNFRPWHRVLFLLVAISFGTGICIPIFSPGIYPPIWFVIMVLSPVIVWVLVTIPRMFGAILSSMETFRMLNSFNSNKYFFVCLKPTEEEIKKYKWLPWVFYSSIVIYVVDIIIFLFLFIKNIFH